MEDSSLSKLPPEMLMEVLERLNFKDLLTCSSICKDIAVLADDVIVRKGSLRIKYPFPPLGILSNLSRSYRCLTLFYRSFIDDRLKHQMILAQLFENKAISIVEVKLHFPKGFEGIVNTEACTEFFALASKTKMQTFSLTSEYGLQIEDFDTRIKQFWPNIKVKMNILKGWGQELLNNYSVPTSFECWYFGDQTSEIQMLNILKALPNIRRLRCHLLSDQNPKEVVVREMQRLQLSKVSVKELILEDIYKLHEDPPSLSLFRNLTKLIFASLEPTLNPSREDKFKFIQKLYSNNCETLKYLDINVGADNTGSLRLLPAESIKLVLEHITFNGGYGEEFTLFVKVFVCEQLANLKSICIYSNDIDDEMIRTLARTEHLEKLSLNFCTFIDFEAILPDFFNLKTLEFSRSCLTYSSLHKIFENNKLQATLESLSFKDSEIHGQKELTLNLSTPNFLKLRKLNFQCDIDSAFVNGFHFHAPELEQLKFNCDDSGLFLERLLYYPKLKVLDLGHLKDAKDVHSALTKTINLEILEATVNENILMAVTEYLVKYGKNLKLAIIAFIDSNGGCLESLESGIKEPDYIFEFCDDRANDKYFKISNISTTIIFHSEDRVIKDSIYKNFIAELCQ